MKKTVYSAAIVVLLSGICISCLKTPKEMKDSYAGGYYEYNAIKAYGNGNNGVFLHGAGEAILRLDGAAGCSEGFDSICSYYGDHGYNRESQLHYGGSNNNNMNAMHIVSMDVACLSDYNETHRAGSSLNDIVYIVSTSPYRYIKGRYKPDVDWEKRIGSCSDRFKTVWYNVYISKHDELTKCGLYPVDGMLNEVDRDDLAMMGTGSKSLSDISMIAYLEFTEKMVCETSPVRIAITLASGEEMSCELVLRRW